MTTTVGTKLIDLLWTVVKSEDSPFQSVVTVLVACDQEGKRKVIIRILFSLLMLVVKTAYTGNSSVE